MTRSKYKMRHKRRMTFKNRDRVLNDYQTELARLFVNKSYFKVLAIIGTGGCGKSRLVEKLMSEAFERGFKPIRVSLESEASGTQAAPLKAIRNQLKFECMLFDVALARYFSASGQIYALATNPALSENIVLKSVEAALGISKMTSLPLAYGVEAYKHLKKQAARTIKYTREEFEEIDGIKNDSEELLNRLPYYLGLDIERRLDVSADHFVFFYDSYEKQQSSTLTHQAPWLREFIGAMDRGLHIVASREFLNWPQKGWSEICIEPYEIDTLPEADVKDLFIEECDPPDALLPKLIELSGYIPFYVEVLVTEYHYVLDNNGVVEASDLPSSSTNAIERLIGHLEKPFQRLVIALATIQFFNEFLLNGLVRGLGLNIDLIEARDILNAFFIEVVDEQSRIYKTHDLLSKFVRENDEHTDIRRQVLLEAATILSVSALDESLDESDLVIFSGLCAGSDFDDIDDPILVERLIDIGYYLYDNGHWQELAKLDDVNIGNSKQTDADLVRSFFKSLSIRRIISVDAGLSAIKSLHGHAERFGVHSASLDIETAYLTELSGDYTSARSKIEKIYNNCSPFDANLRPHYRALLYHADFQVMDGKLDSGSDILLEAYENIDPRKRMNWAELVRHRAHAFRFSALLDEAEDLYLRALNAAQDTPAMKAKLLTNIAETRCLNDSETAIEDAYAAIKSNELLGNKIEVSKAYTALAIASARRGEFKQARDSIDIAEASAHDARYPSGNLFAKQAHCLLGIAENRENIVEEKFKEMMQLINQMGTYAHIGSLIELHIHDIPKATSLPVIEWVYRKDIISRQKKILDRFSN